MKHISAWMLVALVIMLGVNVAAAQDATETGIFEETDCFFTMFSGDDVPEDVVCGYVTVPEEHANPDGPTLRLAVAILPATGEATGAPLFMAQGGPGGSSIDVFAGQETVLNADLGTAVRENRDIVLIDQRGTLYSEPFLRCEESIALTYDTIELDLDIDEAIVIANEASQACYKRLTESGINLSAFDSIENANDMNTVREALEYDQIVFYGVSYGTLLAQHYMRLFPDTLESVILDAVVPTSVDFITATPNNAMRSFNLLFESCANDSNCVETYGDLEALFFDTINALNEEPAIVPMTDLLNDGATYNAVFDGDALAAFTFQFLYVPDFIPLLPFMIQQAADGVFTIPSLVGGILIFDFSLADAMYSSVVCAEEIDVMVEPIEVPDELAQILDVSTLEEDCATWFVEELGPEVDEPVVSDIPTLVMSGEFDPITPPGNGDIVAETLSNAFVYTFPAAGHGALFTACGADITVQFINDPTTEPDASCIDNLSIRFQ